MTCKGGVLQHTGWKKPQPKTEKQKPSTIQVWMCCYWDVKSNLQAETCMLGHFCSCVVADVGCTHAKKHCSDDDNIFWWEGSNII